MLRVWLPLLGNLDNYGIDDTTFSIINNNGKLVSNTSGKLGSCYERTASEYADAIRSSKKYTLSGDITMMCWAYISQTVESSGAANGIITNHSHSDNSGVGITVRTFSTSDYRISCSTGDGSSRTYKTYYGTTNIKDAWHHLALTYSAADHQLKLYVDGEVEYTLDSYVNYASTQYFDLFNWSTTYVDAGSYRPVCKLNDVRLYDNLLPIYQIKEIAKGLVAHYQLNDPYSTSNLIPNGNGDLGASGWSVSYNISTTEIPAVQTRIKASYYTNINNTYIPITQGTSYTFSVWLKQKESSGKTYPSFYPYDVDKKFIYHQSCADGFGAAYKTTLAQPLKKGDTVIYATDLSAWTTATNNYYFYCAIFGYKDSFGHTYADMTYTGDSPAFGTYSDKSHIDKTNNTITLNAPFTGEDRPAGTLICQATQGSGYYYPVGGIDVTAISDWTFKSTTITPSTVNRLKYAKYIQFYAYPNAYYAGISLTDNQYMPEIVYDSSGYNYHGVSVDTEIASISPRNNFSTDFNSVTSYIEFPNLSFMPTMLPDEWTFSFWVYNNDAGSRSILFSNFNLGGVGSNSFGFEKTTGELLRVAYVSGKFDRNIPNSTLTVRVWTHIAVSKTKAHLVSVYRNGVLIDSYTNSNCASSGVLYRMGRDSRTDSTMYRGCLSDFRIYTTVLSADDILALYNTPVSIANNGTMFTQGEFVEG